MIRPLVFLPEMRHELAEVFKYYEAISPGRGGDRFESAFNQVIKQIKAGVATHYQPFKDVYRVMLSGYPYHLYYLLEGEKAVMAALLYARFDPSRIRAILERRTLT